jgi:DoxX-like family
MNVRSAGYWTTTTLTAFAFLTGSAPTYRCGALWRSATPPTSSPSSGRGRCSAASPSWRRDFPRLKEWAYSGITFDLTGAAFSHAAMGDPAAKVIVPLVLLGIAAASWALRPASRMLGAGTGEPAPARTRETAKAGA